MDEVIKLVKTYRLTFGLAERLQLAEAILPLIEPDLPFFVFSASPGGSEGHRHRRGQVSGRLEGAS